MIIFSESKYFALLPEMGNFIMYKDPFSRQPSTCNKKTFTHPKFQWIVPTLRGKMSVQCTCIAGGSAGTLHSGLARGHWTILANTIITIALVLVKA